MADGSLHHVDVDSAERTLADSYRPDTVVSIPSETLFERFIRRATDIVVSVIVLVLSAPLLLFIALLMRFDSRGPALFFQERVGQNRRRQRNASYSGPERRVKPGYGRPFKLVKFRSMYIDARERFPDSYRYQHTREELYTLPMKVLVGPRSMVTEETLNAPKDGSAPLSVRDPRVTPLGYWIRKTSVDELPNFWNVLKGEMSIVGPRPDLAAQLPLYEPQHLKKLEVKPGVTGLPQVMGRGTLTFMRTNELDVTYVENRSLLFDWKIIIKTISEAIKGYGT